MKDRLGNIVVTFIACVISLLGMEFALRLFGDDVLAMGNQFVFFRFDEKLGWYNNPDTTGYFARAEYRIKIDINSQGMRDREPLPPNASQRRVAVLGDSFVWGVGVEYGERFTELLEKQMPGTDALNYGVSGFGTTQELVLLDSVLQQKPDQVVVALCLSNDVMESVSPFRQGYNKPFARRGANGSAEVTGYPLLNVKAMGPTLIGADSGIRLLYLYNMVEQKLAGEPTETRAERFKTAFTIGDDNLYGRDEFLTSAQREQKQLAFDLEADLLRQMKQKVDAALGPGRFLVAFVPTKVELTSSDKISGAEIGDQLLKRLRALNIDVVDPRSAFTAEEFLRRDGHWNTKGHQLFANILAERLSHSKPVD